MKQKYSKIVLIFMLVISNILIGSVVFADFMGGNSVINMAINIMDENNTINDKKIDYWSGEPMKVYNQISTSGTDLDVKKPYMLVKVPKSKYMKKPVFVESDNAIKTIVSEDKDFWYARYNYKSLKGDFKAEYKVLMNFENKITPPGTKSKVTFQLCDSKGNVLKETAKTFVSKAESNFESSISLRSYIYDESDEYSHSGPEKANPILPNNTVVNYYLGCKFAPESEVLKKHYRWGLYYPKTFTYEVQFDKNLKFVPKLDTSSINGDYKWDETNKKLTVTVTFNDSNVPKYIENSNYKRFTMNFEGGPYDTWFKNTLKMTIDKGLPTEKVAKSWTYKKKAYDKTKVKYEYKIESPGEWRFGKGRISNDLLFYDNKLWDEKLEKPMGYEKNEVPMSWKLDTYFYHREYNDASIKVLEISDDLSYKVKDKFPYTSNLGAGSYPLYFKSFVINSKDIRKYGSASDNLEEVKTYLKKVGYKLVGINKNDEEVVIKEKVVLDEIVEINDSKKEYKKIIAKFDVKNPLVLKCVRMLAIVNTDMLESEKEKWKKSKQSELKVLYRNDGGIKFKDFNNKDRSVSSVGFIYVKKGINKVYNNSRIGPTTTSKPSSRTITKVYKKNPKERYLALYPETKFSKSTKLLKNRKVKNVRDIVLLPYGVEYVRTDATYKNGKKLDKTLEPQIIKNYKNTGKTALIYSMGDYDKVADDYDNYNKVIVDPTKNTSEGTNFFEFYSVWDNTSDTVAIYDKYIDKLDLNNNGKNDEIFLAEKIAFKYILPSEVILSKYISLDKKTWVDELDRQDIGEDVYYKLKINNLWSSPIKEVTILDTLPYKGDHTMTPDEKGNYLLRGSVKGYKGSDYTTPLVEPIENLTENEKFLKKFDVFYSTIPAGNDIESVSGITDWKTKEQITDFTKVKNIKFVMKKGQEIPTGQSEEVIIKSKINDDINIKVDDKSINSFVSREGNKGPYREGNEVISRPIKYSVEGTVFIDNPKDGKLTDKKEKLASYKVQLVYAEDFTDEKGVLHKKGEVVVDHGKKETLTDANGHYFMNVYKRGKYKIKFINQSENQGFTDTNQDRNKDFSNIKDVKEEKVAYSDEFTLDPYSIKYKDGSIDDNSPSLHRVRNAGIVKVAENVKIKKIGVKKGQDFDSGIGLEGVIFSLTKIDDKKLVEKKTTDDKGNVEFKHIPLGEYELKEEQTLEGYKKLWSLKVKVTVNGIDILKYNEDNTIDNARMSDEVIEIKNELIYGFVSLIKVDAADRNKKLSGVEYGLFAKGYKAGDKPLYRAVTDKDGKAEFTDVEYGNYKLKEIKALQGYVLSTDEKAVEVKTDGQKVSVGTLENRKIKGSVSLIKVDAADRNKKLSGVEYGLFAKDYKAGDKPLYRAVTDKDGKAEFTDVEYGSYKLKEIKALQGYVLSTDEKVVEVKTDGEKVSVGTLENRKIKGSVSLIKVDAADRNKKLSGVEYGLFAKDYKAGDKPLYRAVTDKDGKAEFTDVEYGNYKLKEIKALQGYVLSADEKAVEVKTDGEKVSVGTLENRKIKGSVSLIKVDAADRNKKLSGVEYGLFVKDYKAGDKPLYRAVTDKDGKVEFTDVEYGSYKLKEIKALQGYVLSADEKAVEVKTDGEKVSVGTLENRKQYDIAKETPKNTLKEEVKITKLPKTGDGLNSTAYAKFAFVIGSILLICGIKFRKK